MSRSQSVTEEPTLWTFGALQATGILLSREQSGLWDADFRPSVPPVLLPPNRAAQSLHNQLFGQAFVQPTLDAP